MSKEHIIYNFLINDRGLIHQGVNFPPGSTFLNPLEQEDEAIDGTEKHNKVKHMCTTCWSTRSTCSNKLVYLMIYI